MLPPSISGSLFNLSPDISTGIVSTITQSLSKWRRTSSDGKSNLSQQSHGSNASQMSNNASHVSAKSTDQSLASIQKSIDMTAATPILMRKRKASGETVPFSASKKFVYIYLIMNYDYLFKNNG